MAEKTANPYLTLRLEGPAVKPGRMKLDDFIVIAHEFSNAVKRVATVLMNRQSLSGGWFTASVVNSLSLDLVGYTHGSPAVVAFFERTARSPQDQLFPAEEDLGERAYSALVAGLDQLVDPSDAMPIGYDLGVLMKLRDMGKALDRGITTMEFTLNHRPQIVKGALTPRTYKRVRDRIARPQAHQVTVEGRLLMADFKETGRQLRIHPPVGLPILCRFEETLEGTVEECLRANVKATGKATYNAQGAITTIDLTDVDPIEMPAIPLELEMVEETAPTWRYGFWENISADEYAARQGVRPVEDVQVLYGSGEEPEDWAGFDEALEEWRAQDPANK